MEACTRTTSGFLQQSLLLATLTWRLLAQFLMTMTNKQTYKPIDATFSHGVARITSLQNQTCTRGCCVSINKQFASCGGWRATVCPPQQAAPVCAARQGWDSTPHCGVGVVNKKKQTNKQTKKKKNFISYSSKRAQVALFQIPLVEADKKMNRMGNKQLGGMRWNYFYCGGRHTSEEDLEMKNRDN